MAQPQQNVLNHEMASLGLKRYWKRCSRVLRADAQAPHLKFAMRQLIDKTAAGIADALDAGKHKTQAHHLILKEFDARYLAHLALVHVITSVHAGANKASHVANQLGLNIEAQRNLRQLKQQEPKLYRYISQRIQKNTTLSRRTNCIVGYAKRYGFEGFNQPIPEMVRISIGLFLLTVVLATTGLVCIKYKDIRRRKYNVQCNYIHFTDEAVEWFQKYHETHEQLDPVLMPRVEPAPDWSEFFNSSDSAELPSVPLIKHKRASEFQKSEHDFSTVFAALNVLQHTPWVINRRVLDVANHTHEAGWVFEGMDGNQLLVAPEKPSDIETNEIARKNYSTATRLVYEQNVVLKSNIVRTGSILKFAEKFKNATSVYFQYNVDFRGRTYALQHFLNPQGCDLSRGFLQFRDGKPVGSETGRRWLAIHGANCWGMDKHVFSERLKWVEDNTQLIIGCASDPIRNKQWTDADCPFQFLAFCFEWKNFQEQGYSAITRIPVQIDGSNNGLQILSLLSRDELTGAATNCTASADLHDIYAEVAEELKTILKQQSANGEQLAVDCLNLEIDRQTCKRSVMTTPYGLTMFSSNAYVLEWLNEYNEEKKLCMPIEQRRVLSRYLGAALWKAIQRHLGRSKSVMQWLQKCIDAAVRSGVETVQWTTPTGFVVRQNYVTFQAATKKIAQRIFHRRLSCRWAPSSKTKISKRNMVAGISPNFVHSLDASCLHLAVLNAHKLGLENFMVVHDSFGTLAPDVEELGASVRFAYATTFRVDQLNVFANQLRAQGVHVPSIPEYGKLDVNEILESEYVFA